MLTPGYMLVTAVIVAVSLTIPDQTLGPSLKRLPMSEPVQSSSTPSSRTSQHWDVTGWNMEQIRDRDEDLAAYFFDTPLAFATGNEDGRQNQAPESYSALPTLKYESYSRFRRDVRRRLLDPSIKVVSYNPEKWHATPYRERKDPQTYMRLFAELASSKGYLVFTAPSRDLMYVKGAECSSRAGETLSEAFLRCRMPEFAARHADGYRIQAQVLENDPITYREFVIEAAVQARAANPSVTILSNLSTSPYDYVATSQMLFDACASVRDLVDGHYLSINSSELDVAVAFLEMVQSEDGCGASSLGR
jgi:hypothetical protein